MSEEQISTLSKLLQAVDQYCSDHSQASMLKAQLTAIFLEDAQSAQTAVQSLAEFPAESKHITILLSDIRGFTALTETYSARIVVDILNRYFTCMSRIIARYGGTIDKFMGDSIMALFGAPTTHPDDVERAIACAVEMQQTITEFNQQNLLLDLPEIFIGIGINSGTVMAGTVGSEIHREYTVIGDEVNLVSRIEAQSLRGQILLSQNTHRLAADYVEVGPPNEVSVKGRRQSVKLYELLATKRPYPMRVPRREARTSPRVQVQLPVFFQILQGKTILSKVYRGETLNLSYNGMQAFVPVPLTAGSEIRISLSLQLLGEESTEIYAKVIKSQETNDGYHANMEFTGMGPQGELVIKQYVDNMIF